MKKTCLNCNSIFDSYAVVDGIKRTLHKRKYCLVCSPFGQKNTRTLESTPEKRKLPDFKTCTVCNKNLSIENFYVKKNRINLPYPYCKECTSTKAMKSHKITSYDICDCGNKKTKKSAKCKSCSEQEFVKLTRLEAEYNKEGNKASKFCRIREHARNIAKINGLSELPCNKCGYSKHVEICHIKSISDFNDNSLISEINDINNIIQLCPNCHWEFDRKN